MNIFRVLFLLLFFGCSNVALAILPTGRLDILPRKKTSYSLFVSQASFGDKPAMGASNNPPRIITLPPEDNPLMCDNVTSSQSNNNINNKHPTIMMVPRGECSFEQKAWNVQTMGADAILIYGTLHSRYSINTTKHEGEKYPEYSSRDIIWPQQYYDYDCSKGRAQIPAPDLRFKPLPYNAEVNDPLLTGDSNDNLCMLYSDDELGQCESKRCLVTGNMLDDDSKIEACCAWDLHIWLWGDATFNQTVTIPAAFLTMEQADSLLADVKAGGGTVQAVLSTRYRPSYNSSSILIWLWGVFVCALAAYLSAEDIRYTSRKVLERAQRRATSTGSTKKSKQQAPPPQQAPEDSMELTPMHAAGFIVMASTGLFVLFFFKIYRFVKIMYAFGCSSAMMQVIFLPLTQAVARRFYIRDKIIWRTGTADFGDITHFDIAAGFIAYLLGGIWLYLSFTLRHPDENIFYWVMQDIMGTCMCIVFLGVIKLNSIRVATILLISAFCYDIFMVFVTPYLFKGESVMITVATSGGPPKADPSWCEKYPDDTDCQGGDPLPMLMTIPRIGDYMGGSSLLGLGDIVLPGLLLSFAARLDSAKELVGIMGGGNGSIISNSCPERRFCFSCSLCSGGYFPPLIIAYAIGLLMANMAVYLMNMGQPALLYLVPMTLGTMSFMGWRRNELRGLWDGPKVLDSADRIIYGGESLPRGPESAIDQQAEDLESSERTPNDQQAEEGDGADTDDMPLLATNGTMS